jgi:ABC-2 type transport system ATP-binding protein
VRKDDVNTQPNSDWAIRCQGLSKHFGEIQALNNLCLEIPAGTVFGFVGRNGAGKTTTIRLLTGLAHPTSGTAWINGIETTNGDSKAREEFGYLPQNPAFYSWMTPQEYLDYVSSLYHMPSNDRKQRIDELLEFVELQDAGRRRIGGFSGGMIQRLGIAQALIHRPPVLLLDEPTSALDPAGRYEVLNLIDMLRGQVTVFVSSHILQDVERVCDTIGIIHKGELIIVASRDELLDKYPVNVVEFKINRNSMPLSEAYLTSLDQKHWVTGITQEGNLIRVTVSDLSIGKQKLLPLTVEQGIILDKYEWVRPSLEEIFLKISA